MNKLEEIKDEDIKYSLSPKQIKERMQWLQNIDDNNWIKIQNFMKDDTKMKQYSAQTTNHVKDMNQLKTDNVFLGAKISYLEKQLNL